MTAGMLSTLLLLFAFNPRQDPASAALAILAQQGRAPHRDWKLLRGVENIPLQAFEPFWGFYFQPEELYS
jgi:hypothetical protein